MKKIIYNGTIVDKSTVHIDIEDRGYQFGDGIYEVIRIYNGKLFTEDEHLKRLIKSATAIEINMPYSIKEIKDLLNKLINENNVTMGIVYIQVSRGVSPRKHSFTAIHTAPVFIAYTSELEIPKDSLRCGVSAITIEDIRWLRCDIKSLNLLPNVLAKQKATAENCFEAIQYRDDTVTEGSSSNVWIVKEGIIKTHPANNLILNGITRQVILSICKELGMKTIEEEFTTKELLNADEVFLTGTTTEVMPIIVIDNHKISTGIPGPVTKNIQSLFTVKIESKCGPIK
ncbi:D-alanine transaminase [Metabacillus crassostreae]|uniref:D-amino-acid transaminase n=1 Tax=Metabacillus crassostreae TaxID=929098 RepID=UPI001956A321|nr:D-amino-acid transaminase [Metabacillus crassostreae]MBM7602129.1 D-alanine transaminase [Metabacillus crassostreae]